jgi:cell division initiation protein
MKLTPLDIRHKEFRRSLRGYSDEEVDVFLDDVADEFERIFQENIDLKEKNERLDEQVSQFVSLKETLQKTLITAQQQSDEMRSNARKEAELVLRDADLKSRDIVNESYSEKQRVQQALAQLKQVEEDFRFKFRSLLEQYLNSLAKDEDSEDRKQLRGLVAGLEAAAAGGTAAAAVRPAAAAPQPPARPRVEEKRVMFGGMDTSAGTVAESPQRVPTAPVPPSAPAGIPVPMSAGDVDAPAASEALVPPSAPGGTPASSDDAADALPGAQAGEGDPRWLWKGEPDRPPVDAGEVPPLVAAVMETTAAADEPTDHGLQKPRRESSVRRFLFGSKDEGEEDLFKDQEDRDFQW